MYVYIYIYTHKLCNLPRQDIYIKIYGPFVWMGCNCLQAKQIHYEETVYFLPEIPASH